MDGAGTLTPPSRPGSPHVPDLTAGRRGYIWTTGHVLTLGGVCFLRCLLDDHVLLHPSDNYLLSHALGQPRCIGTSASGLDTITKHLHASVRPSVTSRQVVFLGRSRRRWRRSGRQSHFQPPAESTATQHNTTPSYPSRGSLLDAIWQGQVLPKCEARKVARGHP